MRASAPIFGLVLLVLGLQVFPSRDVFGAAPEGQCALSAADKRSNADLSFQEFDQEGTTATTPRQLAMRGCYREAAEAMEDYLIIGVFEDIHEQRIMNFHLGQYVADAGDERAAARIIAGTKNPEQSPNAVVDWNSYVDGTWAFLVKDRAILDASYQALAVQAGRGNELNASDLARLRQCFDRSYLDAMSSGECAPP